MTAQCPGITPKLPQHQGQILIPVSDGLDRHQDRQTQGLALEPWKSQLGAQGIAPEGVEEEQRGSHFLGVSGVTPV